MGFGQILAIVAQVVSLLCFFVLIIYIGRLFKVKPEDENSEKLTRGLKNGMITLIVGILIAQAVAIVAQICL